MKKIVLVAALLLSCIELIAMTKSNRIDIGSEAEFNTTIAQNPRVVALFSIASCAPCKLVKPLVDALTKEMQNVMFLYIDGDNKSIAGLVNKYAAGGFPTIKIFKDGEEVGEVVGAKTKPGLRNAISKYLGLTPKAMVVTSGVKPVAKKKLMAKKPAAVKTVKAAKPAKAYKEEPGSYEETITEEYEVYEELPSGEEETVEEGEEVEEESGGEEETGEDESFGGSEEFSSDEGSDDE